MSSTCTKRQLAVQLAPALRTVFGATSRGNTIDWRIAEIVIEEFLHILGKNIRDCDRVNLGWWGAFFKVERKTRVWVPPISPLHPTTSPVVNKTTHKIVFRPYEQLLRLSEVQRKLDK